MSHQKHSRVGRLPRWQRLSSHLVFAICALSGLAFFLVHELHVTLSESVENRTYLIWHGCSAAFALLAFGSVLPGHVRSAWNVRRNRGSGGVMVLAMATLMISGLLLYYGDEEWHDTVLWSHWTIGFAACAAFPLHLWLGRLANRRAGYNDRHNNNSTLKRAAF